MPCRIGGRRKLQGSLRDNGRLTQSCSRGSRTVARSPLRHVPSWSYQGHLQQLSVEQIGQGTCRQRSRHFNAGHSGPCRDPCVLTIDFLPARHGFQDGRGGSRHLPRLVFRQNTPQPFMREALDHRGNGQLNDVIHACTGQQGGQCCWAGKHLGQRSQFHCDDDGTELRLNFLESLIETSASPALEPPEDVELLVLNLDIALHCSLEGTLPGGHRRQRLVTGAGECVNSCADSRDVAVLKGVEVRRDVELGIHKLLLLERWSPTRRLREIVLRGDGQAHQIHRLRQSAQSCAESASHKCRSLARRCILLFQDHRQGNCCQQRRFLVVEGWSGISESVAHLASFRGQILYFCAERKPHQDLERRRRWVPRRGLDTCIALRANFSVLRELHPAVPTVEVLLHGAPLPF